MGSSISKSRWFSLFPALIVILTGCPAKNEKLVPVEGKVLLGGQPVPIGMVTFTPDKDKGNNATGNGMASLSSDGSFKLNYGGKNGVPPGWYKVSLAPTGMPTEMPPAGQPIPHAPAFNHKYQNPNTSGIAFEVIDNPEPGRYDIKLVK